MVGQRVIQILWSVPVAIQIMIDFQTNQTLMTIIKQLILDAPPSHKMLDNKIKLLVKVIDFSRPEEFYTMNHSLYGDTICKWAK